jgi:predicted ester cyclase
MSALPTATTWSQVVGTHSGEWLGLPATGRIIEMRVMDFYRLEGNRIAENWVPIDVIYIIKQMGYDIIADLSINNRHRNDNRSS